MLNFGKIIHALHDKKKNIQTLVLSEKKILNETKNHNPPLQVKWSVPYKIIEANCPFGLEQCLSTFYFFSNYNNI